MLRHKEERFFLCSAINEEITRLVRAQNQEIAREKLKEEFLVTEYNNRERSLNWKFKEVTQEVKILEKPVLEDGAMKIEYKDQIFSIY